MVLENSRILISGDARILVWEMSESSDDLLLQFEMPEILRAELDKRKSEQRKREFLGTRLALKALLGREVVVVYSDEGKPSLLDNSFQISISHSKNWIAVMIHPQLEVGIDIECPSPKIEKVYTRFLSEQEQQELYGEKEVGKLQIAWSAKEALFKLIGKEAVDFANHLRILAFEIEDQGELKALHLPFLHPYHLFYLQNPSYTLVYGMG